MKLGIQVDIYAYQVNEIQHHHYITILTFDYFLLFKISLDLKYMDSIIWSFALNSFYMKSVLKDDLKQAKESP